MACVPSPQRRLEAVVEKRMGMALAPALGMETAQSPLVGTQATVVGRTAAGRSAAGETLMASSDAPAESVSRHLLLAYNFATAS